MAEGRCREGLDGRNALGGLNGEGCDRGDAEKAVGGENLEIGGNAGAVGGVKAGNGEGNWRFRCGYSFAARQRWGTVGGIVLWVAGQ